MLNVAAFEKILNEPCICALLGKRKTVGMAQHVRMSRERQAAVFLQNAKTVLRESGWRRSLMKNACTFTGGFILARSLSASRFRAKAPNRWLR
jgi:hypothetical protein